MEITNTSGIIDVKEATRIAIETAKKIFEGEKLLDLALEEVELTEDDRYWLITLGFSTETIAPVGMNVFGSPITPEYTRKYKLFKIDTKTGEVYSIKIRALPAFA